MPVELGCELTGDRSSPLRQYSIAPSGTPVIHHGKVFRETFVQLILHAKPNARPRMNVTARLVFRFELNQVRPGRNPESEGQGRGYPVEKRRKLAAEGRQRDDRGNRDQHQDECVLDQTLALFLTLDLIQHPSNDVRNHCDFLRLPSERTLPPLTAVRSVIPHWFEPSGYLSGRMLAVCCHFPSERITLRAASPTYGCTRPAVDLARPHMGVPVTVRDRLACAAYLAGKPFRRRCNTRMAARPAKGTM